MLRLLCWLTFGHWKRKKVDYNERNTVTTTYCFKCGEQLEQRQVFDKEPWKSMLQNSAGYIQGRDGTPHRLW